MEATQKISLPLTSEQIKKVNATALADKHNCSNSYVSRALKKDEMPVKGKAKDIIQDAILIIQALLPIENKAV